MESNKTTNAHKIDRILTIDVTRGLCGFLIPMAHTLLIFGTVYTQQESWLGQIVHFFGKWAGIFLLAMGFSYTLSKNRKPVSSIKRGLRILGIGYLMNFLKFIIPGLLGLLPKNFIEAYGWTPPLTLSNMFYMLLTGDILQLAGVCLIFMGFIHKFSKKNKYITLAITLFILSTLEFIRGFRVNILAIDYIFDLLWGADWNVYFAVFPWFGYILVGMFFGYWYKEQENNQKFIFKMMLLSGIILTCIGGFLCFYDYEFHMRDYFHLGIGGFIYLLGYNLIVFWLMNTLISLAKPNKFFNFLVYCSKRITVMYVIQWTLICWGMVFFGFHSKTPSQVIPLMILFTILTVIVQKIYDYLFVSKPKQVINIEN